ncbi:unnamed protein product [Ectocarpus fasciculatus]
MHPMQLWLCVCDAYCLTRFRIHSPRSRPSHPPWQAWPFAAGVLSCMWHSSPSAHGMVPLYVELLGSAAARVPRSFSVWRLSSTLCCLVFYRSVRVFLFPFRPR